MTLLVHADYDDGELRWKQLGLEFEKEFIELLKQHGLEGWMDNIFVNDFSMDDSELKSYEKMFREIIQQKQKDKKNLQEATITKSMKDSSNMLRKDFNTRLNSILLVQMRKLIEKYEKKMYNNGYVNEMT